jgi:hypothetical protein
LVNNEEKMEGKMKKRIIAIMFSLVFVFPALGFAGELKLVKGKGVPVCEAHLKNLEALKLNKMVCQRDESYPEKNGITRPKWEIWELEEHKELVRRIEKFLDYGDQFTKVKMYDDEAEFEGYLSSVLKSNFIKISAVDIANNSKLEKVLLYSNRPCDLIENIAWNRGPYSRPLLVIDEANNRIDVKKTEPLLQNPFPRDIKAKAVNNGYQLYDIFFYKNASYFDKWNMRDLTLRVYNQSKGKTKEVCKYKYIEKPFKK